jgi:hypothetical protein
LGLSVERWTGWSEIRNESDHDSIDDVAAKAAGQEQVEPDFDEQGVAEQLVAQAREKGVELVGPEGLLSRLEPRWRRSSVTISATTSTTRSAETAENRVTGCGPNINQASKNDTLEER